MKLIFGAKLIVVSVSSVLTVLALLIGLGVLATLGVLAALGVLGILGVWPAGTRLPTAVFEVRTTTNQLSSELIPATVNLVSLR